MNHVWQRAAGLALAVLLLAGCGRQPFVPDVPDDYRPVAVRDVEHFPQDLDWFAERAGNDVRLRDESRAAEDAARFRKLFYAAWDISRPGKGNADFLGPNWPGAAPRAAMPKISSPGTATVGSAWC